MDALTQTLFTLKDQHSSGRKQGRFDFSERSKQIRGEIIPTKTQNRDVL